MRHAPPSHLAACSCPLMHTQCDWHLGFLKCFSQGIGCERDQPAVPLRPGTRPR